MGVKHKQNIRKHHHDHISRKIDVHVLPCNVESSLSLYSIQVIITKDLKATHQIGLEK